MKRIFGVKTWAGAILHMGLVLAMFFLCFGAAVVGRDRGKDEAKGVLVSKPKAEKAETEKGKEEEGVVTVTEKQVLGKLTYLGPLKEPTSLGIEVVTSGGRATNREMYFRIDSDLEIVGKGSLDNVRMGDTIAVVYDEVVTATEKDEEEIRTTTRIARAIKFKKSVAEITGKERIRKIVVARAKAEEEKAKKDKNRGKD